METYFVVRHDELRVALVVKEAGGAERALVLLGDTELAGKLADRCKAEAAKQRDEADD